MFKSTVRSLSVLTAILGLGLCAPVWSATNSDSGATSKLTKPVNIQFGAAMPGTGWYAYAGALRTALLQSLPKGSVVDIHNTAMSIANAKLLARGRVDMIMDFPPVMVLSKEGKGPFSQANRNMRGLVGGMDVYYQRVTAQKDSPINSLAEIKEKQLAVHIGTASKGSLNEYMCRLILEAYGLSYDDIKSYGGSVTLTSMSVLRSMFKDGRIDMIIGLTTAGHPNTAELANTPGEKFLGLDQHAIEYLVDKGFAPATMPANLFEGQTKPIDGVGFGTALYVNQSMPDNEAYAITRAVMEARETIKKSFQSMKDWTAAASASETNLGVPLHAGAKAYYEQAGLLKGTQ